MNYEEARRRFAFRLRTARKDKEITQEKLAELIEKSTEHISFLERGERSPSFETIVDIAEALNLSVAELMHIDAPIEDINRLSELEVDPISIPAETISPINLDISRQQRDIDRLKSAVEGIREMQRLADDYGIRDILQDNGGKVLQVCILLGLKVSSGREGNDALDGEGNEYELKTVNRALAKNRGVTTHHHLNKKIINKYRSVKAWFIAIYEGIELIEIYRLEPEILEPLFEKWEQDIETKGAELNNPKIPLRFVMKGERVYPTDTPQQKSLNI